MSQVYTQQSLEAYQKQASDLVTKLGQLQQMQQQTPQVQPLQMPVIPPAIQYVRGMDGAREYLNKMPPNGNTVLMDRDEALFYVVSKDANGNPAPIAFARFELETEQQKPEPEYVTKQDFEALKTEILTALQQKGATA